MKMEQTVFRNVGIYISDTGESPKRKHRTIFVCNVTVLILGSQMFTCFLHRCYLLYYVSPQIRKITNLFRHTKVKIAFKCNNRICQLMKPSTDNNTPYYNRSGIYKLICNTCKLAYVGQTSRSLKLRFQEHT